MAERDRYDRDRGRDYDERDREYGRGSDRERGYQDRGMVSRGADEVRSWFGDDEAQRRREMDEQRDRSFSQREREGGPNSERARREHGWGREGQAWESGRGTSAYGDQRDFVGRGQDWSGSQFSPRGREWYDPGYDRVTPRWTGGSRDYGDEDSSRRYGNWQYSGAFGSGHTSPSFSGGYGAGNYESGNYRTGAGGYGSSASGGPTYAGRDVGYTGEGRWSGQPYGSQYSGGSYGGASTGSFAGRGPRNYQRSDERIREDVNERLTADPRVDASDIEVRVQNGEVTLSGSVDERRARRMAEEIIEDLPGVRDVRNEIRVSQKRWGNEEQHRYVGEQSRGREDGAIGHTGNPQQRDDVTTLNTKETKNR
jgi:hypothetical protein